MTLPISGSSPNDQDPVDALIGHDDAERPDELDSGRMGRRAMMRLAAAGTGAAVAFAAPRVEGMRLVPDYAAAASGNDLDQEVLFETVTDQAPKGGAICSIECCITCWNTTGIFVKCGRTDCGCGTHKTCGDPMLNALTGSLVIPKLEPVASSITFDYSLWGPTEMLCSPGTPEVSVLDGTVTGIDPPFQNCTVTVDVDCGTGTPTGTGTFPFAADGSLTTLNPGCTGSVVYDPVRPPASRCPDAATLTLTFECIFD